MRSAYRRQERHHHARAPACAAARGIRRAGSRGSVSASISSFTCMVPSCAAKAAPVRPAMMMPAIIAPISRVVAIADEVRDVDLGPELAELDGADVRQDDADEEADEADDRQRLPSALLQDEEEVGAAEPRRAADEPRQAGDHLAEKAQDRDGAPCGRGRAETEASQPPGARPRPRVLSRRHRGREREQALDAARQAAPVRVDLMPVVVGEDLAEERDQARVPAGDVTAVEDHPANPRQGLHTLPNLGRARERVLDPPAPREPDQERVGRGLVEAHARRSAPIDRHAVGTTRRAHRRPHHPQSPGNRPPASPAGC